jgi:hypothetical protein
MPIIKACTFMSKDKAPPIMIRVIPKYKALLAGRIRLVGSGRFIVLFIFLSISRSMKPVTALHPAVPVVIAKMEMNNVGAKRSYPNFLEATI